MTNQESPPPELTPHLKAVLKAWVGIGSGRDVAAHRRALSKAQDAGFQAAVSLARRNRPASWTSLGETSFTEIIAENLRNLRLEAGWTQQQVADAMTAIGFNWARETVVEVERTGRKAQLEEVVGIAVLFGVAAIELFLPDENTALGLRRLRADRALLRELMLGRGGKVGEGGSDWVAAIEVLGGGKTVERPAVDLWQNRSAANPKSSSSPPRLGSSESGR